MASKLTLIVGSNGTLEVSGDEESLLDFVLAFRERAQVVQQRVVTVVPNGQQQEVPHAAALEDLDSNARKLLKAMSSKELYTYLIEMLIKSGDKGIAVGEFFNMLGKDGRAVAGMQSWMRSHGVRRSLILTGKRIVKRTKDGKTIWYPTKFTGQWLDGIIAAK